MSIATFFLVIILLLTGLASYGISRVVHKRLVKAENANANVLRVVTMIGSFVIILAAIFMLIIFNVPFER